ncbi:alpha/beta fold hydrolase [Kribbella sp. NBC_00359]|uniref:alpha/beta fold hydrolase n=1 Tax=Kribbella sp. NBC_00359 TaxID=2975966 RepID=UPI002E24CE8E
MNRRRALTLGTGAVLAAASTSGRAVGAVDRPQKPMDDELLAGRLDGDFHSHFARVNGVRLHYVAGGKGEPLVLVPGWPATWWSYHKVMPLLARHYRVIVVDIRGMGASERPAGGYDKKTMARDIYELVLSLGYRQVNIAGHDIGAMVAFSFAANHGAATRRVALLDVLHPDETLYDLPMLTKPGAGVHMWWWAFNQVKELPGQLLQGRSRYLIDWHYGIGLRNQNNVTDADRRVYTAWYDDPDAIRASNGWYQAVHQDIADMKTYAKVTMPLLGLIAATSRQWFEYTLPQIATDIRGIITVDKALHWLCEEDPDLVASSLLDFLA